MKKAYIQPSVEAIVVMVKQPMLEAMSGASSTFGSDSGIQHESGSYVVNGRSFDFDDED